ncbi:MAG: haloacid dehalogenase [Candidatus Mesenet longicola]|uniref:phosphoglycolate phosphatase n=1 Tax=Candidatus Mesenet longicola TaxID=1892558 RepID=A0A8J3MME4_9RICK|nr:MAG: haloacid dehalogenase [Candidatus Mesenet longicola]GHM59854.1 MAG: haloacid dehalogenase [Candidatus Mesenet longicola]
MLEKIPKAIVFDWDNTLIDSQQSVSAAINHTLKQMGSDNLQASRHNYVSRKEFLVNLFGDGWQEAGAIYQQYLDQQSPLKDLSLNPGVVEMLRNLTQYNLYLAIVSNKDGNNLREEVAYLGLSHYFKKVVGSGDTPEDKPSPLPLLFALEDSNIKPSNEVLFVGDSITDVHCAQNANCLPVVYGKPMLDYEDLLSFENFNQFMLLVMPNIGGK